MSFFAADTPERHRNFNNMLSISLMYEISPGFSGQSMLFPSSGATIFPYQSSIGFSSLGPIEMDFVDPSQTTHIGAFDVHSPMHLMEPLQFESLVSDYALDQNSPITNMPLYMQYEDCKSALITLSQASTNQASITLSRPRQPTFEPVRRSSAALQQS
jgi:hypothetical protein